MPAYSYGLEELSEVQFETQMPDATQMDAIYSLGNGRFANWFDRTKTEKCPILRQLQDNLRGAVKMAFLLKRITGKGAAITLMSDRCSETSSWLFQPLFGPTLFSSRRIDFVTPRGPETVPSSWKRL